jgi:hypothetical protein
MRLVKFLLLVVLAAMVGRLVVRTVSVESTGEKVSITIDRQRLREAGRDLKEQGREAAQSLGQTLQQAGKKLEEQKTAESD